MDATEISAIIKRVIDWEDRLPWVTGTRNRQLLVTADDVDMRGTLDAGADGFAAASPTADRSADK